MSIIEAIAKIVESFRLADVKIELKDPIVNYKTQTNNIFIKPIEMNNYYVEQISKIIADKILEELKIKSEDKQKNPNTF